MHRLPDRSNLDHLKKQAKDLLRSWRNRDPQAIAQFRASLPAAAGRSDDDIAALKLRLHDAQSCVARAYGFASWMDLRAYVEAEAGTRGDRAARTLRWLALVYAGEVAGGGITRANPRVAVRVLAESPDLAAGDPYVACAIGHEAALQAATAADPGWINRPGGPLRLPPLLAVTHSSLLRVPEFREHLRRSVRFLLAAGADPNQRVRHRLPPASVSAPGDSQLSALYGAAGVNFDPELTRLLLETGANPNDGESLYHSLESIDCARLLLEYGARIEEHNALYRALDFDNMPVLELLLAHGADANVAPLGPPVSDWGTPLLWAIYRRRSRRHVEALLKAGASPLATTPGGVGAYSLALQLGLRDVAALLRDHGAVAALSEDEQFVAACAGGDEAEAQHIRARRPDLPGSLPEFRLRLLPDMVAAGGDEGAKLMVRLGWPIAARGGDWNASALNLAVFLGNAQMTLFLLEHGASWKEEHGYGDNVSGTLGWASCNEPAAGGDWVGCAQALLGHGFPRAVPDPGDPDWVLIDGRRKRYSDEVREVLLTGDR